MNNSHRTYRIPSRLRKGWIKSNIDVNWEKMIVFSSPLERSLISFNSRIVSRILADSGGTDPVTAARDFRLALLLSSSQPVQYVASRLDVLVEVKLDNRHYDQYEYGVRSPVMDAYVFWHIWHLRSFETSMAPRRSASLSASSSSSLDSLGSTASLSSVKSFEIREGWLQAVVD